MQFSFQPYIKYFAFLVGALVLIFFYQRFTKPDTISFALSHEEVVPVGKISVVVQFTSRQVAKEGLLTAGDNELNSFLTQISNIPGVTYQESAAQTSQVANNYQYLKTLRIDLADGSQYSSLKNILDAWPIQVVQTIFTPAQDPTLEQTAYENLVKKSREQGKNLARANGKQLGGIVSVIESAPQLREGSSNFTTYSPDGTLVMTFTKSATFQYSLH